MADEHICHRDKEIADIYSKITETHKIVVGNGTPEKGLANQVSLMNERQDSIKEDISEIKNELKSLGKKYTESIETSQKAIHAVEKLKNEDDIIGRENDKLTAKKRVKENQWYQIVALVIAALGLLMMFNKKTNEIETKVREGFENLGTPYVIDQTTRGIVPLPDSAQIKFSAEDSLTYTITRIK